MPLPTERTVTGKYTNPVTGEPYYGVTGDHYVVFEPVPARWTDQSGDQILLGGGRINLDANGAFNVKLVCTDAPGVLPPQDRLWRVRQYVGGVWSEQLVAVPMGDGSPLDISDLLSVDVSGTPYVPVEGPRGPVGPPGAQGEPGLDGSLDTGITWGGDLEPSATSQSAVDISPFVGRIVDYSTNPPTVTPVESSTTITVELDDLARERSITWLLMDEKKNVFQQEARPTSSDRRNFLVMGMVLQRNGIVTIARSIPTIIEQSVNQFYDFLSVLDPFNITGNVISPNGANLLLDHSPGQVFSHGWNYFDGGVRTSSPHIVSTVGAAPAPWIHVLRGSQIDPATATPVVNVAQYDDQGTLTTISGPADRSVVHRLWIFPTVEGSEIHVLQYGQKVFDTLDDAVQEALTTPMAVNPALPDNAIPLACLAVKYTATDLSDPTQAKIIPIPLFGGGGGGGSVDVAGFAQLDGAEFTGTIGTLLSASDATSEYSRVTGDGQDRFRRTSDGTMRWGGGVAPPDAMLTRLAAGVLAFLNTDLIVGQEGGKALRLRQSGTGSLGLDAAASDLLMSVFDSADFAGSQRTYLRLESATQLAHAIGRWVFTATSVGDAVHTIDGAGNMLGFHGAAPVTQQTVSGNRSDGGALANLLSRLDTLGLIKDSSAAGPVVLKASNNLSDVANVASARQNLGLGSYATANKPPHVFNVTDYGAVGDGKIVTDAAMTAGSSVLTCSTSTPFTSGDVGKSILILNAGPSGETLVGLITAYASASQVTLSVTASSTVSGVPALWATDDTARIQAAIDAAVAYALAHSYAATVYIPPAAGAFYGVAGALKTGGSTLGNAQLTLPVVPTTGRKLTLTIEGANTGAGVQHWQQTFPNTTGSTLVSFGMFANATAQANSINNGGNPAVIGGPSQPGGYGVAPGVFSNIYVDIGNLSILTCHSRNGLTYTAIDLSGVANAQLRDMAVATSGAVAPPAGSYQNQNLFATGLSIGILLPANGNNDNTIIRNVTIGGGYTYGMLVTEHTDIYGLRILYCWAALCPVGVYFNSVGAAHSIHGTLISIEQCTYLVYIFGPGTGGIGPTMYLKIDTETSTPRFGDRTSGTGLAAARGEITLAGLFTASNLTLDAPTGLKLRNSQLTYPVTTKSGNYTATAFDQVILGDANNAPITITLPNATGRTDPITVKKTDSSANTVTVAASGGQSIDSAATKVLSAQWEKVTVIPSGGNWYVV